MKLPPLNKGECYRAIRGDTGSIFFEVIQDSEQREGDLVYFSVEEVEDALKRWFGDQVPLYVQPHDRWKNKKIKK